MGRITHENVRDIISHHAPSESELINISNIRKAAESMIITILNNVPECADQTVAIRCVREAMMNSNAAIALKGKV